MIKYFKFLLFSLIFIFLGDFTIGKILGYYYPKVKTGYYYHTSHSINKTEAEILVFGHSRASHHYNPKIIEKMTGHSCFNAGRDGQSIFYHTSIFNSILKRHTPKIVVLEYDGDFNYEKKHYDRISSLLPYYEENKDLGNVIELKSRFESCKLISKIYTL